MADAVRLRVGDVVVDSATGQEVVVLSIDESDSPRAWVARRVAVSELAKLEPLLAAEIAKVLK